MKWLLLLGARSDMGRAIARRFAKEGFNIILATRDAADIGDDQKDLETRFGVKTMSVIFDALDFSSHNRFLAGIPESLAGVVCVVGYLGVQRKAEEDFDEAEKIIDTNYTGCVSVLNRIANDFEKKKEGFIIGVSSVAGDRGRQSNYIYGSAKAGFTAYLSGLRNRLAKTNVAVVTVKPGFVYTRMTEGIPLPVMLTAQPEEAAEDIFRAWKRGKDIVYTRWFWRYIMLVIRAIPEKIFKKLSL